MFTRILDIVISLIGLFLLLPILPWVALLIKLDSNGPVFYRCPRIGRGGNVFQMYKFRTMYETPINLGPSISPGGDPRVTPVGRVLRRLKLNEFPQFINVFIGDMTLIGPRPEAPDLAAAYPEEAKKIFSVKPGLAGPNQILGRNEEELFPPGVDPVKYYIEHLLPRKLPLDLAYIDDNSFFKNLKYLFLSVKVTLTGAISRQHLVDNRSQIYLMLADTGFCLLSFSLAHVLRFEGFSLHPQENKVFLQLLPWVVLIRIPVFIYFGFYHALIRHLSFEDIKSVFKGVTLSSIFLMGFSFVFGLLFYKMKFGVGSSSISHYSRGVFLIDWFCLTFLLTGYRFLLKKLYRKWYYPISAEAHKRVLIWGAGDAGELCLRYLKKEKITQYEVVGFIDDERQKRHRRMSNVKVLGDRHHLKILAQLYKVEEVFVAMPSASEVELKQVIDICRSLDLDTKLFQLKTILCPRTKERPGPFRHLDDAVSSEIMTRVSVVADH